MYQTLKGFVLVASRLDVAKSQSKPIHTHLTKVRILDIWSLLKRKKKKVLALPYITHLYKLVMDRQL